MENKPNWNRFIRWVIFNVLFALLPLFSVWFFRLLLNKGAIETTADYPEILFFSIMVCATALSDVNGRDNVKKWNLLYLSLEGGLVLGAIALAIIYGGLKLISILDPPIVPKPETLRMIFVLITVLFITSVVSEILITLTDAINNSSEMEEPNEQ